MAASEPVAVECTELGGAERTFTWSMPADATLRDCRAMAGRMFGMHATSTVVIVKGDDSPLTAMDAPIGILRGRDDDRTAPLQLIIFAGV